jgi:hypothetical protein
MKNRFVGNLLNVCDHFIARNQLQQCSQLPQVDLSMWRDASAVPSYSSNYVTAQNTFPGFYPQFNVKK